jgi:Apea-like HEPN
MKTLHHPEAIKAFIVRLKRIAENLLIPPGFEEAGEKSIGSGRTEGCYTYGDDSYEQFNKIINDLLLNYNWSNRFSKRFLGNKINTILAKAIEVQSTSSIEEDFPRLISEYESFDTEQLIITPCLGFAISEPGFLNLGRVTLRQYDDKVFKELNDRGERIRTTCSPNATEQQRNYMARMFDEHIGSKAKDKACSEFSVVAENRRATELALEETRKAITLVRYAALFADISPIYQMTNEQIARDEDERYFIGILGDVSNEGRRSICIPKNDSNIVYSSSKTSSKFVIDNQTVERMDQVGVFVLSSLFQKNETDRTEFQKVLLSALRWLASAQTQVDDRIAFLNLMTCLETIFKIRPGDPISASISSGVAMVTSSDVSKRKERKKKIVDLYTLRSKLTHEGEITISAYHLFQLTNIVRDFMMVLIKNTDKFTAHSDFIDWLEDQKMGAVVNFPL